MSKMKDTIITLYVDTTKIIQYSNKEKDKVLDCVLICDNHDDVPGREDFTSYIKSNSKLSWVGAAMNIMSSKEDFVIIKDIKSKKGSKSFIKIYNRKNGAGSTHIDGHVGKIKDSSPPEEYKIKFMVNSSGVEKKYTIDPKIKIF